MNPYIILYIKIVATFTALGLCGMLISMVLGTINIHAKIERLFYISISMAVFGLINAVVFGIIDIWNS